MERYIDAEKLKQHSAGWGEEYGSDESKERKVIFDTIIDLQPTADVVPVVRCKDCRFYETNQDECVFYNAQWVKHDDDFCPYGERRKDVGKSNNNDN